MSDPATAPATDVAEEYRTITRNVGDVIVSVNLPVGCPDPHIELTVYSNQVGVEEREAMIRALGPRNLETRVSGRHGWLATDDMVHPDMRAVVFLPYETEALT